MARLSLYKRQSCSYLAPATVLIATLSIIAHIHNNATLKTARQSSRYGEARRDPASCPSIGRGRGRRSETRQEFSARSQSGTSRRLGPRKEAAARTGRAGGGGRSLRSWIESAVGLVVESRGAGFRGPARSRPWRAAVDPDHAGGKTQARVQDGHSAIGRACGSRLAAESRQRGSENRRRGRGRRSSWKTIGTGPAARLLWGWAARAGRISQARLMEAAGWVWRGRKPGAGERRFWRASGLLATGMGKGDSRNERP